MEFTDLVTELKRQRAKVAAEEKADPNKDRRVTAKQIDGLLQSRRSRCSNRLAD